MVQRYERFNNLKQQNPSVKTLLAVGGWNLGSAPFTRMVATDASRREFATTTVQFLKKNGFDGLDVDWEYPANRGSPAADRDRYTELLKVCTNRQCPATFPKSLWKTLRHFFFEISF